MTPESGSNGVATPAASATPDGVTPTRRSVVDQTVVVDGEDDVDDVDVGLVEKKQVEIVVDMSTTGDWNGLSTLEKPRETDYDRPTKGWKTSLAKTVGFFLFFGINGLLIGYLVPMVFRAMLGL